MSNPFELNTNLKVEVEVFRNSNIYRIDNFYRYPDRVLEHLQKCPMVRYKARMAPNLPSFNHIHFYDDRHMELSEMVTPVYDFLSKVCGQDVLFTRRTIQTNVFRFIRSGGFNTYRDSYWHPHLDFGYNGLAYLNQNDNTHGTNLYEKITNKDVRSEEHYNPWQPKNEWKILKTLEPKFNRLVLFDGKKFYHGMNITSDKYFDSECRINQAYFFKQA